MTKRPIKIATAQSFISQDVCKNGWEIRRLMKQARSAGATLVHFPEGAISGYTKSQIKSWDHFDWDVLVHELQAVVSLARELGLWVVVGCCHRLTSPHRPHNSLYVISSHGELITRYDKQFCSNTEITRFFTPGRQYCVFEVEGWRFGCALCIEIHFPELFQKYAELGIDCLLFSSYSEESMFGIQAQGHAASNNYWISISVPAQTSHALSSRLVAPTGIVQAAAPAAISELVLNQLDEDCPELEVALRFAKPWRAKARNGEIYRRCHVDDVRSDDRTRF